MTTMQEPIVLNGELATDDMAEPEGFGIGPYDITSSPNDFNVATIFNFMETGTLIIPEFQRNYVWDLKHASKLIEVVADRSSDPTDIPLRRGA